jgi:hypothetical protein
MTWQQLRDSIYFIDGSLRDILVKGTTKEDWIAWADFVNSNYKTSCHVYETNLIEDKIDINYAFKCWKEIDNARLSATVYLNDIVIKCYFFTDEEIENDITPTEINSMSDHRVVVDYMLRMSDVLSKTVILTPENMPEIELVSVSNGIVTINI